MDDVKEESQQGHRRGDGDISSIHSRGRGCSSSTDTFVTSKPASEKDGKESRPLQVPAWKSIPPGEVESWADALHGVIGFLTLFGSRDCVRMSQRL